MKSLSPVALACALACTTSGAHAQTASEPARNADALPTVTVKASADASAEGLSPAYAGGQVARGGRAGILGTKDNLDTPFSITSYTNELIQDRQAKSVGDVLQNDPGVRLARGFGNFQESYFIRGFLLSSDDVAYNGLYSLLPRQYIATELFERVEVLRGASSFLMGASPGGGGIGGAINLLPKRATNEPLTRVTAGVGSGGQGTLSADVSRRFGPDNATGIRVNAAGRAGGTSVDDESNKLGLLSVGVDWRSRDVRLSGDLGWQDNRLKRTRTNVTLGGTVTEVLAPPDASSNYAQPWSYSNERDVFGTLRGEVDVARDVTAWGAYGLRRSREANSLANLTVTDNSGTATTSRFDNTRRDQVDTLETGIRGKLNAGPVRHEWVASASYFELEKKTAYRFDFANTQATNLYDPVDSPLPAFTAGAAAGGDLAAPNRTGRTRLTSVAIGDTLGLLDNNLLVTVGLRHQQLVVGDYAYVTSELTNEYDKSRVSPVLAVVYKLSPKLSAYGNYIEGLTQGETAGSTTANRGESLSPYVSKQKEIGLKYDGGQLGATASLFSTTKPRGVVNAANVFTAEGEDRHQGLEVSAYGRPLSSLRVLGGFTWLDAKQKTTGSATTGGKRVIGVPKFQATLGAEWDVPVLNGLAVDGRVVHTGDRYADGANTLKVPGWTRLDAGLRYLTSLDSRVITLRARVENLTDRDYWASSGGYPGNGYLTVGAPRTFNLSVSVDF